MRFALLLVLPLLAPALKVEIFYDALCKTCSDFFGRNFLEFIKHKGVTARLDLQLNPFSQGSYYRTAGRVNFNCVRGQEECRENTLHACVLSKASTPSDAFKFISCLSFIKLHAPEASLEHRMEKCASLGSFDTAAVRGCVDGEEGPQALLKFAEKSRRLPRNLQPIVKVDDEVISDRFLLKGLYANLTHFICSEFEICDEEPKVVGQDAVPASQVTPLPQDQNQLKSEEPPAAP